MDGVTVVRAGELRPSPASTPGMDRQEAFAHEGAWAGKVQTTEGVLTGWHTHPGWDTYVYVLSGSARIEYGPGGTLGHDAGPGDFILIPRGQVHREGTSVGSKGVEAVIVRVGEGELVSNVDGPEPMAHVTQPEQAT